MFLYKLLFLKYKHGINYCWPLWQHFKVSRLHIVSFAAILWDAVSIVSNNPRINMYV